MLFKIGMESGGAHFPGITVRVFGIRPISEAMDTAPGEAEKRLAAAKEFLSELKPESAAGKQQVMRGKLFVTNYEEVLELSRVSLADLETACGSTPDRNLLLACLLLELQGVLEAFAREGFAPLRAEWQRVHAHQDKRVTLMLPDGSRVTGRARGVAEDGSFLLETRSGVKRYHSGEISLRPLRPGNG